MLWDLLLFGTCWLLSYLLLKENQNKSQMMGGKREGRLLRVGKEFAYHVGDLDSIPGLGRSPREGKGYPLQYSGLENSMDCMMHRVTKESNRLSDFNYFHKQTTVINCSRNKMTNTTTNNRLAFDCFATLVKVLTAPDRKMQIPVSVSINFR